MTPEVEQIFIWLTYSHNFSLLEPLSTEALDRLDGEANECCPGSVFHEIKPLLYENLERAPGKPRYTAGDWQNDGVNGNLTQKSTSLDNVTIEARLKYGTFDVC